MGPSDIELMAAIAARSDAAFGTIYDRHAARVFGLLLRMLPSPRDAEDVLQEVFWQLWSRADEFDPQRGQPLSWLLLIARSRALDHRRRLGRVPPTVPDDMHVAVTARTDAAVELAEQAQRTQRALARLPAEQRVAIERCFFDGLTHRELADQEDVPLGTVKTRIRLGMNKLRDMLMGHERVRHGAALS